MCIVPTEVEVIFKLIINQRWDNWWYGEKKKEKEKEKEKEKKKAKERKEEEKKKN